LVELGRRRSIWTQSWTSADRNALPAPDALEM